MSAPRTPADFQTAISSPTATLCGNFINTLLKLPTYVYEIFNWMLDSSGNVTNAFKQQIIPSGSMMAYGGTSAPDGWLFCQGQAVLREDYPELFAAIGIAYGPGNGTTTFNVPDGRVRVFLGAGTFDSGATAAVGGSGGEEKHTLETNEFAGDHTHVTGRMEGDAGNEADNPYLVKTDSDMGRTDVSRRVLGQGGSGAFQEGSLGDQDGVYLKTTEPLQANGDAIEPIGHNNLQPYFAGHWIIKT